MARKDDLEHSIRESYDIIRQDESIIRTSDRPEEKTRARRIIDEQQSLVEEYQAELDALTGDAKSSQVVESGKTQPPQGSVQGNAAVRQPSAGPSSITEVWDVFISHASKASSTSHLFTRCLDGLPSPHDFPMRSMCSG